MQGCEFNIVRFAVGTGLYALTWLPFLVLFIVPWPVLLLDTLPLPQPMLGGLALLVWIAWWVAIGKLILSSDNWSWLRRLRASCHQIGGIDRL